VAPPIRAVTRKNRTERARRFAADLAPSINKIQAAGITSPAGIAAELTRLGISVAADSSEWRPAQVAWVLHHLRLRRAQDPGLELPLASKSAGDEMATKAVATPQAREAARRVCMAQADARAVALAPVIREIRASGATTPYAIAAALTARGIPTARGHRFWMAGPVRSILVRLDRLSAKNSGAAPTGAISAIPGDREPD
jgi:hypothetical protein